MAQTHSDAFDTDNLLLRLESDFGECGLASAWIRSYSHWQIVLRSHRGSQVRYLELRFWHFSGKHPRTCPLLCLRIPHLKDHGVPRNQVSSIRGRYSTLHGDPLPGSVSNGGSLTMCLGDDVLVPRQRASIEFNQVRGHDPWLKAGSFQVGARRLVWISAMVMWRSGTKSKSSVFIWTQPCQ